MAIRSAGSNIVHGSAIQRLAKSIGPITHVCQQFEKGLGLLANKDYHSHPSFEKEFKRILQVLKVEQLLSKDYKGDHQCFKKTPLLESFNWTKIIAYVKEKINKLD